MNSPASSGVGDQRAFDQRLSGETSGAGNRPAERDVVGEVSDLLIDRMFAIGLNIHNELVRSQRDVAAPERRSAATVTIRCAIDELDQLIHNTRASMDRLDSARVPPNDRFSRPTP
ncbi:hypothetical protein [Nocardia sp. N2S4-5]|uniref:hypothetical protein n=1 Tax=Nocardia sp. N2S4-5 TaxID=3351565 RepID=UPI0037CD7C58